MPKKPEIIELDLSESLFDSRRQATSMALPVAIHYKLDLLAELARMTGASRAEIVGMLIAEADLDPARIEGQIMDYRKRRVGEILPTPTPSEASDDLDRPGKVVAFEKRGPGRPRKRKAG